VALAPLEILHLQAHHRVTLVETLKVGLGVVKTALVVVVELVALAVMEHQVVVDLAGMGLVHLLQA
jgi:hypothetical protein